MEAQISNLYVLAGRLAREEIAKREIHKAFNSDEDQDITPEEMDDILDESVVRAGQYITARLEPQFAA